MASSGKKKTTMAKLTRESKLRERRLDKKDARKRAPAHDPDGPDDALNQTTSESDRTVTAQPALETVTQAPADA
jgi:hypothetical protein